MSIHFILSMGSLLLMTIIPIAMYVVPGGKAVRITLITIWSLSVATVYTYLAVILAFVD
jgi:hypothetical protein